MVMIKDLMTVKGGVGPKIGETLYRDFKKREGELLYFEYKGILFRDVLEQDVALVRDSNVALRRASNLLLRDKETGMYEVTTANKFYKMPSDKEILERIRSVDREKGQFAIAVFDIKTKQFIALLDVETMDGTDYEEGVVEFLFAHNKVLRRLWENKVKKYFVEICQESWLFRKGCVEKINLGDHYKLQEIPT